MSAAEAASSSAESDELAAVLAELFDDAGGPLTAMVAVVDC